MKYNFKHIYFIGIGGISMSAIAELMLEEGIKVSGSDRSTSKTIDKLKKVGATIHTNHDSKNIDTTIDFLVYTSAISLDNPELLRAKELNIEIMDRAEFLGYVMKNYKHAICVSGTHGKTTSTGMLSSVLLKTDLQPTIFLGGEMDFVEGNLLHGSYQLLLTEACEYKRNFLKFNPTMGLILNIEEDHLDYYRDLEDIERAFVEYAEKIPEEGYLILDEREKDLFKHLKCNLATFGLSDEADYYADNIKLVPASSYTLMHQGQVVTEINLKVFGQHNILNSLAVCAACLSIGIDPKILAEGLQAYKGIKRRYEYKGQVNGARLIDDYAHHPTEMEATIETARAQTKGKIITIFQPHTYTRTIKLLDGFAKALSMSDEAILLDIYAAREKDTGAIHSKDIIDKMKKDSKEGLYAENFEEAVEMAKSMAHEGDIIISMGAGNIDQIGDYFIKDKE